MLKFLGIFLPIFLPIILAKDKIHNLLQIFDLLVELNSGSFFIFYNLINNQNDVYFIFYLDG